MPDPPPFDRETVVFVNTGPSLDRLGPKSWQAIAGAGEVVSVNGALLAEVCLAHEVRFTAAVAMDAGEGPTRGLDAKLPGFLAAWERISAWRITKVAPGTADAETFVRLVPGRWCEEPDAGYAGGGSAASACNWFANPWPDDPSQRAEVEAIAARTGRRPPRRGYRRFAFLGLDMVAGQPGHARGLNAYPSGFADSPERDRCVRDRWRFLSDAAAARGIEVRNYSPGTGLDEMPRGDLPRSWLLGDPR